MKKFATITLTKNILVEIQDDELLAKPVIKLEDLIKELKTQKIKELCDQDLEITHFEIGQFG